MLLSHRTMSGSALVSLLLVAGAAASPTHQFDQFFPGWDPIIQQVIRDNCTAVLDQYRTGDVNASLGLSSLVTPVINCILDNTPEFRKAEMAASAVVLGLAPTVLQSLASTTGELSLLSLRRPLFSFLLGSGSPGVSPLRAFEYEDPLGLLAPVAGRRGGPLPPLVRITADAAWPATGVIAAVEYALVCASLANVVVLSYQLGVHAIVIFTPETIFSVPLWTFLAAVLHVGGFLALWLRVRVVDRPGPSSAPLPTTTKVPSWRGALSSWLRDEALPSEYNRPLNLEYRPETVFFIAISWLISVGTVIHALYGTLVLSSLLFYSVVDSLNIVSRYCASVLVCRIVLMYELAGMRAAAARNAAATEGRPEEVDNNGEGVRASKTGLDR